MDYAPDLPIRTPDLLYDVNMVPDVSGNYVTPPVPINMQNMTALSETIIGAYTFVDMTSGGQNEEYYGSRNKLFSEGGSISSTAYSLATDGGWCMLKFGNAFLAANGQSLLQYATNSGGVVSDLAGSPKARIIIHHENAVIGLNIAGVSPQGWATCDTADPTQWSSTPSNNADSGVLYGGIGGPLTAGATWQKLAVAFKANAMYGGIRVEEVDQAIHWETVSDQVGCVGPNAWIQTELGLIFVGQRDIYIFDGSKPYSIADKKIRRAFFRRAPQYTQRVFLTHDDLEKNIYFWHNSAPQFDAWADSAFVFNYKSGKWGKVNTIQTNGTSYTQARCPLVGAKGRNYYAKVSGVDLNNFENNETSNILFFDNGSYSTKMGFGYRDANSAGPAIVRASAGKPYITTGYFGTPGDDKTFSRLLIVPESSGTNPESATVSSINEAASVNSIAASINDKGMVDKVSIGRYFQVTATWPTSTGKQTITELVPEFKEQTFKPASKGR